MKSELFLNDLAGAQRSSYIHPWNILEIEGILTFSSDISTLGLQQNYLQMSKTCNMKILVLEQTRHSLLMQVAFVWYQTFNA
jgi:hypothetical protein